VHKTAYLRQKKFGARLMYIESVRQTSGIVTMVLQAMPTPVPARTF
jgi:hypothetical protein